MIKTFQLMFGIAPTKDEFEVRNLIASNIEEHIEEYLGSVITDEDIVNKKRTPHLCGVL